jgi:hypothetical protein
MAVTVIATEIVVASVIAIRTAPKQKCRKSTA